MSISELQACIARLYIDDSFRKLFSIDAAGAIEDYQLSDDERAAVIEIDQKMLRFFAASLITKRRKKLERAYPMLFQVGGELMDRYVQRYCQLYTLHRPHATQQDIQDFGSFMEDTLATTEESLPPYASQVAKFERLSYLVRSVTVAQGFSDQHHVNDAAPESITVDDHPRLNDGVEIAFMSYDILKIQEALEDGALGAPESLRSDCATVFQPATDTTAFNLLSLNGPAKTVLSLCDGQHSVADIVAATEEELGMQGLEPGVMNAITTLVNKQILTI